MITKKLNIMAYKKNWNALDSHSVRSGNTLPLLVAPCSKRIHGATVTNVEAGEFVPAGTPFYYDPLKREATFAKSGSGVTPNAISIADCIGGTDTTLIDVPYGVVYIYKNTLPALATEEALAAIKSAGDVMLVFEYFGYLDNEGGSSSN